MQEVTIVGAGLSGLIAAIHIAEGGGRVVVHEAGSKPGGRARTDASIHRVNLGPHAIYRRGDFGDWLKQSDLLPKVYYPSLLGLRLLTGGRLKRMVAGLPKVMSSGKREAPVDESYRSWATREFDADYAKLAIGFAALPTYHPDPGVLSAAFVQDRIARSSEWRPVWYVAGGWITLVDKLAARAEELGVEIVTRSKLAELPDGLCVVATDIPVAARLLNEPDLASPGPDNALFDVSVRKQRGDPTAVLDVDGHVYISSFSAGDASVAPKGESLLQAVAGIREGEDVDTARGRIEAAMDVSYKGWRDRVVWQRKGVTRNTVGPCEMPGRTWQDRPAIDRGRGRWLIGSHVAAPGILAETCFESAKTAAAMVLSKLG